MRCSKCGTNNPSTNNFCAKCGFALAMHCAKCKAENPPTSDFCGKCGAPLTNDAVTAGATSSPQGLASDVRVAPEQPDASTVIDGKRKTVTALFADTSRARPIWSGTSTPRRRAIVDPALKLMIDAALLPQRVFIHFNNRNNEIIFVALIETSSRWLARIKRDTLSVCLQGSG
jgi:ribosomal protein L40E